MTEISEKENEPQNRDLHRPQATVPSQPESKLQRLKRSLSFKSVMRSKSVDNFFQRSNGETRPPSGLITTPPPPPSPPPFSESPLAYERSPSLSPTVSPNPSLSSHSPSISPSLSVTSKTQPKTQALPVQPVKTHCFQEHVFRRPASCQRCKHMIQGNSKQGLRCKACKMAAHLWCSSELSQQPCIGKSGAFKRNFSSPLLTIDPLGVVREAPAAQEADNGIVDPVYEALRYGTSLAQMSRSSFGSISESPCHELEKPQDKLENQPIAEEEHIPGMLTPPESEKADSEDRVSLKTPKRVEVHSIHTYVALYKFLPQEKNDLELQPGDRVQVTDDSNEDWWKGKSKDKVGFFPANFVQRVRPGERVWKVTTGFHGNRDKGQMTVKEAQICVGKNEEIDGFLRLTSGKKRGLVPVKCLLEI
ncbi:SH3 and cysteine-rich domain-containing protein 2 [Seriola lalandi dorsalis]|uniref:SH3 and cysteine-rich domain-containing protein 2 n=1 Tax=Seriola dumerili TaxID=41447 RepID=A0A3B4VEX1_SERDU|nr:SH3 and cysteine-rich domain-containing protein 2-like [Seriola dumerili]XP_023264839.1 SH3 and cysteine-rich domain-containing protein 2 [Seriola lalandi dorsalis]XP_056221356.1 SH3 and cysteine-rich domain-containing protein 2-like [Seriola aureovittata]